jgi:FlaA1/EpsC-like NDP-sugar epimerase
MIRLAQALLRRNAWVAGVFQACLVLFSLVLAWLLRFDFTLPERGLLLISAPVLVCLRLIFMARFRLLHGWWRYVGVRDVADIAQASLWGSVSFFVVIRYLLQLRNFPRSIYVSEALITAGLLAGVRLLSRLLAEGVRQDLTAARQVIVIGAGACGQMILRELSQAGSGYSVIGCLDDDPMKIGSKAQGYAVEGPVDLLPEICEQAAGDCEVIIAIPSANSGQMRRFVELAEKAGLRYRTIPALRELIRGDVFLNQIREVNLDDLLGREPVAMDLEAVREKIAGSVLMVTGAAGSIGSELCRQILEFAPSKLVCLDQSETGIFYLEKELTPLTAETDLLFCVTDVRDKDRLRKACIGNAVQLIFHAAAYKHVPIMECNADEAVLNNVFGLLTLMDIAEEACCTDLVLISSDKAVNPTSIMGSTKRVGELILASRPPNGLRCSSVRFGNVLGSSGSVIPIFQEQLRNNQSITVTDPEIRRFFMTTREAVSLVLQAFAIGHHGDILVLDMGTPIKIVDLAKRLIRLAGKSENDIPIRFTGLRPGEKMSEDLFYPSEEVVATSHAKIKLAHGRRMRWSDMLCNLDELRETVTMGSDSEIREKLKKIVPEYSDWATGVSQVTLPSQSDHEATFLSTPSVASRSERVASALSNRPSSPSGEQDRLDVRSWR